MINPTAFFNCLGQNFRMWDKIKPQRELALNRLHTYVNIIIQGIVLSTKNMRNMPVDTAKYSTELLLL